MNGAILEIEELCGGLTALQRDGLEHGMRDEHLDLVLELCRQAAAKQVARMVAPGPPPEPAWYLSNGEE